MSHIVDIIDDDDAVRESTRMLLESYGYEVHDYPSALAYLSRIDVGAGCLLLDLHMPDMSGLDLLVHLRAKGDDTPALLITARSDVAMLLRAARIGVKLLHKPYREDELVGWIEQVTKASTPREALEADRQSSSG